MFTLALYIFSLFGFLAVAFFVYVMFGVQTKTLFAKQYNVLLWKVSVDSTRGKDLNIKIAKTA